MAGSNLLLPYQVAHYSFQKEPGITVFLVCALFDSHEWFREECRIAIFTVGSRIPT